MKLVKVNGSTVTWCLRQWHSLTSLRTRHTKGWRLKLIQALKSDLRVFFISRSHTDLIDVDWIKEKIISLLVELPSLVQVLKHQGWRIILDIHVQPPYLLGVCGWIPHKWKMQHWQKNSDRLFDRKVTFWDLMENVTILNCPMIEYYVVVYQ